MGQLFIGLGNKARQGKDEAAKAIIDYYDRERIRQVNHGLKPASPFVQRIGFADALYEVARNEYGMTTKDAPLLQKIGHERRQQDPEYWVKRAFAKVLPTSDIVLFTDTRYQNEAQYIKSRGGYIVNVTRRLKDGSQFIDPSRPANHPSEIDLDGYAFDFYLVNSDGHLALLGEQAITLAEYLRSLN